jgi:hypothetical protein
MLKKLLGFALSATEAMRERMVLGLEQAIVLSYQLLNL